MEGEPKASVAVEGMTRDPGVNLDRLVKLRLVVARYGEMDNARWWNTNGLLAGKGRTLIRRGLPKTHPFARARIVFTAARTRCGDVFSLPGSHTIWDLPPTLEKESGNRWHHCLHDLDNWAIFFDEIEELPYEDLIDSLRALSLLSDSAAGEVRRLRCSAEERAVPLPVADELDDRVIGLLAAAFSRGEVGRPTVPYVKVES